MATVSKNLQKNIMEIMSDGESRDIPKIKEDLTQKKKFVYGKDYRDGHLAGVLRVMTTGGDLEKVERGVYRMNRVWRPVPAEKQAENVTAQGNKLEKNTVPVFSEKASLEQIWKETLVSLETQYCILVSRMDAIAMSSLTRADFESIKELSELKEELKEILVRHGRGN